MTTNDEFLQAVLAWDKIVIIPVGFPEPKPEPAEEAKPCTT